MGANRQNPLLPAVILALFFGLMVFLVVTRKGGTAASHQQPAAQTR